MSYNTKQGEKIIAVLLENSDRHLTADDILRLLESEGCPVGKATVYRRLEKLLASGEVRKYIVDESKSACYQFVGDGGDCRNHYHLKCSACGRLLHVECEEMDKLSGHVLEHHGFLINEETTVLYGLCASCRKIGE